MPAQTTNTNTVTFTDIFQSWVIAPSVLVYNTVGNTVIIQRDDARLANFGALNADEGKGVVAGRLRAVIVNHDGASIEGTSGILVQTAATVRVVNDGTIVGHKMLGGTPPGIGIEVQQFGQLDLHNNGYVFGAQNAILAAGDVNLRNTGTIESPGDAIRLSAGFKIKNSGVISGEQNAIVYGGAFSSDGTKIKNSGIIDGDIALQGYHSAVKIQNGGTILGDVFLGADDDVYNGRGGTEGDIHGGGGNDVLKGGWDRDWVFGEDGADTLIGKGSGDRFVYLKKSDSTVGASDTILDFGKGDRIDLRAIDADGGGGDNAKFLFIGTAQFTGGRSEVRYIEKGDAIVLIDINGDRNADMRIVVKDVSGLDAGDFFL